MTEPEVKEEEMGINQITLRSSLITAKSGTYTCILKFAVKCPVVSGCYR